MSNCSYTRWISSRDLLYNITSIVKIVYSVVKNLQGRISSCVQKTTNQTNKRLQRDTKKLLKVMDKFITWIVVMVSLSVYMFKLTNCIHLLYWVFYIPIISYKAGRNKSLFLTLWNTHCMPIIMWILDQMLWDLLFFPISQKCVNATLWLRFL